jgi:putative Mg2+ transporter-C (MgtC) family protein
MSSVLGVVYPHLPSSLELSGRLVFAAVLGACIGLERELHDHPSGLRTHITVAVGSALFGIVSAYAWQDFVALRADNNYQIDTTRIAAQIVSGVGFLGAGAIIKQGDTIRGLTSAAGLWVSAAIGLAVSLGMYVEAMVTTATILVALVLLKPASHWMRGRVVTHTRENIVLTLDLDVDPSSAISALGDLPDTVITSLVVKRKREEHIKIITAEVDVSGGEIERRFASLQNHPDIIGIEIS